VLRSWRRSRPTPLPGRRFLSAWRNTSQLASKTSTRVRLDSTDSRSNVWHSIHKNDLARAMVAQTEQAFLAMGRGIAPKEPTVKILEHKDMAPFFVKGESDEP
jgi:hypothetical protein